MGGNRKKPHACAEMVGAYVDILYISGICDARFGGAIDGSSTIMLGQSSSGRPAQKKSVVGGEAKSRGEPPCGWSSPAYMYRAHICADIFDHSPDDASQSYMC